MSITMTAASTTPEAMKMMHFVPQPSGDESLYHDTNHAVEIMPNSKDNSVHPRPQATIERNNQEALYLLAWQELFDGLQQWQSTPHCGFEPFRLVDKQVEWMDGDSKPEDVQGHLLEIEEQMETKGEQPIDLKPGQTAKSSTTSREVGSKIRKYEELESCRRLAKLDAQDQCERNNRKLQGLVEKLQAQLEDSRRECNLLRSRLEAQELKQEAISQQEGTQGTADLERQLVECKPGSNCPSTNSTEEIAELSAELKTSNSLLSDKRSEVASLRKHLLEANAETDENREIADHLRHQVEDSNERLWALQTETIREKAQLEQTIINLNEELVNDRSENEARIGVLQEQNFVRGVESLEAQAITNDMEERIENLKRDTGEEIAALQGQIRQIVARKYCAIFRQQAQLLIRERKDERLRAEIRRIYDKNEQLLEQQTSTETLFQNLQVSEDQKRTFVRQTNH